MPVILPEQHQAAWLGETDNGNLKELLLPYPAEQMRIWEISPRVNSPENDDPSLWEPRHESPRTTASLRTAIITINYYQFSTSDKAAVIGG
jgi:hypothetical protein